MFSVLYSVNLREMNRGEQETLFRQSHDIRLQQEEAKHHHNHQNHQPQQSSLSQHSQQIPLIDRHRHYSYGNIHQVSNLQSQSINSRSFGEERPFGLTHCDDLVLSVLKSPIKNKSSTLNPTKSSSSPTVSPQSHTVCTYTALQGSEDELVDDVESAKETMDLDTDKLSPRAFKFLRRFRPGRQPKFEPHHRRVPTPMRRKNRHRSRSRDDIFNKINTHGRMLFMFLFLLFTYFGLFLYIVF